jgi:adenylate cyclase
MDGMAVSSSEQIRTLARGIGVRQVRLASGVIIFAYLVSHFLNHALGNISMEALAAGVRWHMAFWQFLPVAVLFYIACIVHTALGIFAFYQRRQFRWKTTEITQLVLGLSVPLIVIGHIIGVRLGQTLYGHEKLYPQEFYLFFVNSPTKGWLMLGC